MLNAAKQIIIEEISLSIGIKVDKIEDLLKNALKNKNIN
jgi:RNA polymerase-interacting CarD/CdnL/TRCF family regulator